MLSHGMNVLARARGRRCLTTVANGDKKHWFKDGLKFSCTGCGKCCSGPSGFIWVTETDVLDISKRLDMEPAKFLKQYARWVPNMKKWSIIEKTEGSNFSCVFLRNGKSCDIYEVRPIQCRTYPYWPGIMKDEKSWKEESLDCEGINDPDAPLTAFEKILATIDEQNKDNAKALELGRHPNLEKDKL